MRALSALLPASAVLMLVQTCPAFQNSSPQRLSYSAIHDPQFIPASEAAFMHDGDRLIGIMSGNVAKAYPAGILSQHGLVEDRLPSGPIAVTW